MRWFSAFAAFAVTVTGLNAQPTVSTWTIRGGRYDGLEVRVDTQLAQRRGSAFFRVSRIRRDGRLVGWNPSRLPARVAFRHSRDVSADDSAAFWTILENMELDLGMHLFEPATLSPGTDPQDWIIVDTKNISGEDGRTYLTWSNDGAVYDARVFVRSSSLLHSPRIVTHEMMHALGFGHTNEWSSIMTPRAGAPSSLTPADIAYAQVAFDSRGANEREDMWERLALADERDGAGLAARVYAACAESFPYALDWGRVTGRAGLTAPTALTVIAPCGGAGLTGVTAH